MSARSHLANLAKQLGIVSTGLIAAGLFLNRPPIVAQNAIPIGEAKARQGLERCKRQWRKGNVEAAIATCEQALATYRQLKALELQAETFNVLGHLHLKANQDEPAFAAYEEAIDLFVQAEQPKAALRSLWRLSVRYQTKRQYEAAIALSQRAFELYGQLGDRAGQAKALANRGHIYYLAKQYKDFFHWTQQALAIRQTIGDRAGQASTLYNLGVNSLSLQQFQRGTQFLQQAVDLWRALAWESTDSAERAKQLRALGERLLDISEAYALYSGPTDQERAFVEQAFVIYQTLGETDRLTDVTSSLADADFRAKRYDQARVLHQKALALSTEESPLLRMGQLNLLGNRYAAVGQLDAALEFKQQALAVARQLRDRAQEANALAELAKVLTQFEQPQRDVQAVESYAQSLALYQELENSLGQQRVLREWGDLAFQRGEHDHAFTLYQQIPAIDRQLGQTADAARFLRERLAPRYAAAGRLDDAIATYQAALESSQQLRDRDAVALTWYRLGYTYQQNRQYSDALNSYQQALQGFQETEDIAFQDWTLRHLGEISLQLGQDKQALAFFRQNVGLYEGRDRKEQIQTAQRIGNLYLEAQQSNIALEFHRQSLDLQQASGSSFPTIAALHQLGQRYQEQAQYDSALDFYRQALALGTALQQQPDYASVDLVGKTFGHLGSLFAAQSQPELAIVFYKSAINAYEGIRGEYQASEVASKADFAQIFLGQHEADYRALAELLLQQNRILEAQRVLDLLKIQELDDYLGNVRGNANSHQGAPERAPESQLRQRTQALLGQEIALGQQLQTLEDIPVADRTPVQREQVKTLRKKQQQFRQQFNQFLASPDVQTLLAQLQQQTSGEGFNLQQANSLQDNLQRLQQDAAILYPLILEDRLELILVTPDAPPIRRTVAIDRTQFNQTILAARQTLTNPNRQDFTALRQLYDWLIAPIAADLAVAKTQTILYAPDGPLRYIPLAALNDGDRWLVERFRINNLTALSLTELTTPPPRQLRVLAGAFSQGQYEVAVGERDVALLGLPYAEVELQTIAATVPNTTKRLNQQFGRDFIYEMEDYNVVHLATHAKFVSGKPQDSFILLGNGESVTLKEVENWSLNNVDLVVLSACETGVGDSLGNGSEILGFGYQMQRAGARAAIASLWSVDDGGTQQLMTAFYQALQQPNTNKAAALQQAQLVAISGQSSSPTSSQRGLGIVADRSAAATRGKLSHPYYWAAFFLIGNGL